MCFPVDEYSAWGGGEEIRKESRLGKVGAGLGKVGRKLSRAGLIVNEWNWWMGSGMTSGG
jgi:hypothetical protein